MTASSQPRIGVFGGTFDPVHHGHLIAVAELRYALGLEKVLLIPNSSPPHKPNLPVSSVVHRLAMLHLAIDSVPWLEIDPIEIERGGRSYSVDTLADLKRRHSDATMVFLMGEDSLRDFPTWHQPAEILNLAEFGVATRSGVSLDLAELYQRFPAARGRIHIVQIPDVAIASRELRKRVAEGRPIAFQVPHSVQRYIFEHRLYRT